MFYLAHLEYVLDKTYLDQMYGVGEIGRQQLISDQPKSAEKNETDRQIVLGNREGIERNKDNYQIVSLRGPTLVSAWNHMVYDERQGGGKERVINGHNGNRKIRGHDRPKQCTL